MRKAIAGLVTVGALVLLPACGSETCGVTALGQKLCGDDLAAWCSATDSIRATDPTDPDVMQAQDLCDKVRN